jgi:hypothetical protein
MLQEEVFSSINKLGDLRNGIPQFLFSDVVYPNNSKIVRSSIIEYKNENPDVNEIDIFVNSPGGLADEGYKIIRSFRKNFEKVNMIVPLWAKSAATLMCLGASTLVMDEYAEFGPLDAQLAKARDDSPEFERESALNDEHSLKQVESHFKLMFETIYIRLFEHKKINIPKAELSNQLLSNLSKFYEPLLQQIDPYKLGDKRRKLDIGAHYAKRILFQFKTSRDPRAIRELVDFLVDGCPDHGYVIDYDLMSLYLDNVLTPIEFSGDEYAKELSNLSLLLMTPEDIDFVGFVIKPKLESQVEEDIVNE